MRPDKLILLEREVALARAKAAARSDARVRVVSRLARALYAVLEEDEEGATGLYRVVLEDAVERTEARLRELGIPMPEPGARPPELA